MRRSFASFSQPHPLPRAVADALSNSPQLFAVFAYRGNQYKVSTNDVVMLHRLQADIGQQITFDKVLMCGGASFTAIGRPFLDHVRIVGVVEEHKKSHNVISYLDKHLHKNVVWNNTALDATIVRILSVAYENPEVVGLLDKYEGTLKT
eukprot:PhF_6_TR9631/c0_g1_i1/m.14872/K02888/RP-L21, MRPL21, rplU; large subunit ribosomal protein L21